MRASFLGSLTMANGLVPSYAIYWGWANFLHLCDVAVFLTCVGLAYNNALLLSSQAVSSLVGALLWCLDAGWRWVCRPALARRHAIHVGPAISSVGPPALTVSYHP